MNIELKNSADLLQNLQVIVNSLDYDKENFSYHEVHSYLNNLSNEELEKLVPLLLPDITNGLKKVDDKYTKIYDSIATENSKTTKSISFELLQQIVTFTKENLEVISILITILQSFGYLDFKTDRKNDGGIN